jgi:hypothetical protein
MINATPEDPDDRSVDRIVREGPSGAVALAGIGTVVVLAIWIGFYLFVFSPRVLP